MKNVKKVKGILEYVCREPQSTMGNPRHTIAINGILYKTEVDAQLGYAITNFTGKAVEATVGIHYGINTISHVKEL